MNIIDSYYRLPLGKYIDILDICEEEMEDIERQAEINAILTGLSVDEVYRLPVAQFTAITAASHFLDEECPEPKRRIPKVYKLGDLELVASTDIAKITTAQYIDFKTFCDDRRHNLPQILSCFLIPKGMEYNEGYDITDVHQVLRDYLSVVDAMALSAFFLTRLKNWMATMLIYSKLKAKRIKDKEKRKEMLNRIQEALTNLAQNGDGWTVSAEWPRPRTNVGRLCGR